MSNLMATIYIHLIICAQFARIILVNFTKLVIYFSCSGEASISKVLFCNRWYNSKFVAVI